MRTHKLSAADVPQANRIRLVAEGLRPGGESPLSARQRGYYEQAALILGFRDADGHITDSGREVQSAPASSVLPLLKAAFTKSAVCRSWLRYTGVEALEYIPPDSATKFLAETIPMAGSTAARRASTLRAWLSDLCGAPRTLSTNSRAKRPGAVQLELGAAPVRESPTVPWPDPALSPHNESGMAVRHIVNEDFRAACELLIVTGYAALDEVVSTLAAVNAELPVRLVLGNEPYQTEHDSYRFDRDALAPAVRDYWLKRGMSVEQSTGLLVALERLRSGTVSVRIGRRRPMHAKIYATDQAVTVGSSNFTRRGLGSQSEANARFTSGPHFDATWMMANGLWEISREWTAELIALLESLLRAVTWQEALGRACAVVLDGTWAREYIPAPTQLAEPLWPHQRQGLAQALHILIDLGSVLIADATGSGKTRMGVWVLRGLQDHLLRTGAARRSPTFPAIFAPSAVVENWQRELLGAELPWRAYSNNPLSNAQNAHHEAALQVVENVSLLAVDEAHNFLNTSERTRRLQLHAADHVVLFTATPINKGPGDLLALVELLGPDNFDDEVLDLLVSLSRYRSGNPAPLAEANLEQLKAQIGRFMVRRTRSQLNAIADTQVADDDSNGMVARYPRHVSKYYPLPCSRADEALLEAIVAEASGLLGVIRVGQELKLSQFHVANGVSGEVFLSTRLASAAALAKYTVLERLRSSRLALLEHAIGTVAALERLAPHLSGKINRTTGNSVESARNRAGKCPIWRLDEATKTGAPAWLIDRDAHRLECEAEAVRYERIAELATQLSNEREQAKVQHLAELFAFKGKVIAYDGSLVTLHYLRDSLEQRDVMTQMFTGQGGRQAKSRARKHLGRDSANAGIVALCTDAFSEGMNLQGASCVVHLDTPTVIRVAEQRAGRVDRMDTRHDAIEVWWPKEPGVLMPRRRELIRERHEVVVDLIGANLRLPDEDEVVDLDELTKEVEALADADLDGLFDAFKPVRDVSEQLVGRDVYGRMLKTQADVLACVSSIATETAWAFVAVGGRDRSAPRWVFVTAAGLEPLVDFEHVAEALRLRLGDDVAHRPFDSTAAESLAEFVQAVGRQEDALLAPRRRRAIELAREVFPVWARAAWESKDTQRRQFLLGLIDSLDLDGTHERPDPKEFADAWIRLLRPYRREMLTNRGRGKRPLTLDRLRGPLVTNPVGTSDLRQAFSGIPTMAPIGNRIVAAIVGVPAATDEGSGD